MMICMDVCRVGCGAAVVVTALACPGQVARPCNSDIDCESDERCLLGLCAPAGDDDAGTSDAGAGDDDDAGASDGGDQDAGEADAGVDDAGVLDAGALDAGTPDAGGCGALEHDGGDGACVPLDACSGGYGFSFLDGDGDGVGAGPRSGDCAALPLAPGRSDVDTDCEPADPTRFQLQVGFDEADGDGFTAAPTQACVGDVPEQDIVAVRRGPPHLAYAESASSSGASNAWSSVANGAACCGGVAVADLDPGSAGETATMVLSNYRCLAVPPRLDALRVRVHGRLPVLQAPQELVTDVTLQDSGNGGATRSATSTWLQGSFVDVVLEGTAADWGLSITDPAALCAGALDARVVVNENGSYGGSVEVDYVVVELLGGDDCDSASASFYAPLELFDDGDNDSYFGGAPIASCVGDAALDQWEVLDAADCDDSDGDARPGQANYFTSQRNGGGWDYNCDGTDEERAVTDVTACVDPGDTTCAVGSSVSRTGSCGQAVDADDCPAAPPCDLVEDTDPIACR